MVLLLLAGAIGHSSSWAACALAGGGPSYIVNLGGISDPNLYALGENIGPPVNATFAINCTADSPSDLVYQIKYTMTGGVDSTVPSVMQTNVPGIGLEVKNISSGSTLYSDKLINVENALLSLSSTPFNYSANIVLALQMKRTSAKPVAAGQSINQPSAIRISYESGSSSGNLLSVGVSSSLVQIGTCRLAPGQESIAYPLPPVTTRDVELGRSRGPSVAIQFMCQNMGQDIYVTFTDANNPANTSNVLSLAPSSTAQNIGVQVFLGSSNTPISFGPDSNAIGNLNQLFLGSARAPGESNFIVLRANYVQTGSPIVGGTVNAVMTYTFSYP